MKTIFAFLFSLIAVAANASTWNWTNAQSTGYMPGDTVNLWGTFTTPLSLTNSGTSGSPITFYFEPNTRFSAPYWPTAGAIQFNFNSNLVVDGGVNGLIECTANGTQLANQVNASGINDWMFHVVIKNLTVTNIYRVVGPNDHGNVGNCIGICGSDITVSNCDVSWAISGIGYAYGSGSYATNANIFIVSNRITHCCHDIEIATGSGGPALLTNCVIAGNYMDDFADWEDGGIAYHIDGIFIYNNDTDPTAVIDRLLIYNNYIGTNLGFHTSGALFTDMFNGQQQVRNAFMFNNTINVNTSPWSDGFGCDASNLWVFNNSFLGIITNGTAYGIGIGIGGTNAHAYNNLCSPGYGMSLRGWAFDNPAVTNTGSDYVQDYALLAKYCGGIWSDYNIYAGNGNFAGSLDLSQTNEGSIWQWGYFYPLVSWQTCQSNIGGDSPALTAWFQLHCDPHSTTNTPLFASLGASLGVPALTDTVAKGAGTNLTWLAAAYGIPALAFDAAGNARPATAAWDIGAFNAQSPGGNGQPQSGFTGYPVNWRKP